MGVPIEFENVCALNKYFKSKENLNIKTQVIGIAIGSKRDIFPLEGEFVKKKMVQLKLF